MNMGNLLSRLTEYDRKVMNRYIDLYAADDNLCLIKHKKSIDTIFKTWAEKKETLSKMFPDNALTIEEDICYKKDVNQIYADIDASEIIHEFRCTMRNAWTKYMDVNPSAGDRDTRYYISDLLANSSLANNKYEYESFTIYPPNKPITISSGMKTSRAIIKIAETIGVNPQAIEDFRIEHSKLLNDTEVHGKMVFSIHPMDFMTMSDNNCRWHSCMSWTNRGEYRQGTVEMMNSPCVVEAYITSDDPYCFDDNDPYMTWNNKKWRELFIVNSDCIMGIKGYPYWSRDLEKIALAKLKTLATDKLGYQYRDKTQELYCEDDYCNPGDLIDYNGNHYFFESEYMYNDFRYSHYGYLSDDFCADKTINYSGPSQCMLCGRLWEIDQAEDITCDNCQQDIYLCSECGVETTNAIYNPYTKSYMCWNCFNDRYVCDGISGDTILKEDAAMLEVQDNYGYIMRKIHVRTSWLSSHWVDGIQELDDGQRLIITPSILRTLQKIYEQEISYNDDLPF